MVRRRGRRLLEYQRAMAIRVAVRTPILEIVRQQGVSSGVALVRLQEQRGVSWKQNLRYSCLT